jgi:transposase
MKRWSMIHKIKALYDEGNGHSIRQIAKELSISRNTVTKYLKMQEEQIIEHINNPQREKALDKYKDYIVSLLQKYPKLSSVKIKRKLQAKGLDGGSISERTFRRYVNKLKTCITVKQERYYEPVIDMTPGVQCQVDLGELRDVLIGGKSTTVYFAVFVLSYSRLMYVSASDKPVNTRAFIQMHNEALSYFDGCMEECVYDQTKLVAIKEEFREVWFNEEFYRYASVAGFDIRVCEGYDPESKGKVESGVKYVKNDFFYGEEFASLDELKKRLLNWMTEVANLRIHGTTQQKPAEVYETRERQTMKPYLRPAFITRDDSGAARGVDKTSLISYKSNKYSVPMKYQSSTVRVKEEGAKLVIRDSESSEVIATHDISQRKGDIIKNNNHYRDYRKLTADREQEISGIIGSELSETLCRIIKATSPKIYKDQLAGLIQVLKKHQRAGEENTEENVEKDLNLEEALSNLKERPRLTVTFIREYLAAFYSPKQGQYYKYGHQLEGTTGGHAAVATTSQPAADPLAAYGSLLTQNGWEG